MDSLLKFVKYSLSMGLFMWILLGVFSAQVSGYSMGADTSLCMNMTPSNAMAQDNSASMYSVEFLDGVSMYYSTSPIRVRIQGPNYEGIMIQVRDNDTMSYMPLGMFYNFSANTQGLNCSSDNDTATHTDTTALTNETIYYWMPPANLMNTIVFVVTVWENETMFYSMLKSAPLDKEPVSSSSSTTEAMTTSTMSMEMTSSMSSEMTTSIMATSTSDMMTSSSEMMTSSTSEMPTSSMSSEMTTSMMTSEMMTSTSEMMTTSTSEMPTSSMSSEMTSSMMTSEMMTTSTTPMMTTSTSEMMTSSTSQMMTSSSEMMSTSTTPMMTTSTSEMMTTTSQITPTSTSQAPSATVTSQAPEATTTVATTTQAPALNITVPVRYTVNETYTAQLANTSSSEYAAKKVQLCDPAIELLQNDTGFVSADCSFASGSIIVNLNVLFTILQSSAANAVADSQALQTSITTKITTAVNNGTITIPGIDITTLLVTVPITCPPGTIVINTGGNSGTCQAPENNNNNNQNGGSALLEPFQAMVALLSAVILSLFTLV